MEALSHARSLTRLPIHHSTLSTTTHWTTADLDQCSLLVETIPDLAHIPVTAGLLRFWRTPRGSWRLTALLFSENVHEVLQMMETLLSNQSRLGYHDLLTVLDTLEDVVNVGELTSGLAQAVIQVVSDLLRSHGDLLPFTNT